MLDNAFPPEKFEGKRYPEYFMALCTVETK